MSVKLVTGISFLPRMRRLSSSWRYVKESFASAFAELEEKGELSENGSGENIWETRSKFVLKLRLADGSAAAFKGFRWISRPWRFILRPSLCGFEAENFSRAAALGIPVPELLAAGDERRCFILKNAFLMTRFAEGFHDGRDFLPGGPMAEDLQLKDEFLRRNLEFLARFHDAGIIHRGFTPANLMWKLRSAPDAAGNRLELLWIDLASCRRRGLFLINSGCSGDLAHLFLPLELSAARKEELVRFYCAARKKSVPDAEKIISALCR